MDFLEYHGLLDIVDGSRKTPTSTCTEEWDKLDKKARFYIGLSLESAQVRQVMNLKTAAEMWTRLELLYELNATSKHLLLQKFLNIKGMILVLRAACRKNRRNGATTKKTRS